MATITKQKAAKVKAARVLDIVCEECGTFCVDHYGSTMITDESETVTCENCWTEYTVPAEAFRVVYRAKLKVQEQ